jgi:hypothetical protein
MPPGLPKAPSARFLSAHVSPHPTTIALDATRGESSRNGRGAIRNQGMIIVVVSPKIGPGDLEIIFTVICIIARTAGQIATRTIARLEFDVHRYPR